MRKFLIVSVSFLLVALSCTYTWSYSHNHGPFKESEKPNIFPINKCHITKRENTDLIYFADLNGDGKEDFIIPVWLGGCGIASGYFNVTFVLSSKMSYKTTVVQTLFPGPEDFIDVNGDGKCEFIQTSFVHGEKGKDGKTHNYWVYNLLEINGDELSITTDMDKQFPKWVWHSSKPNQKATTQLSNEQKQRLWKKQSDRVFWKPEREKQ